MWFESPPPLQSNNGAGVLNMLITSQNAVNQALANIELESLSLSKETMGLVKQALKDGSIGTAYILDHLRSK